MATDMKIKAIAPWFGSNRMGAEHVGKALESCEWVGIPCCASLSEVPYITARTILCSDLHQHVVNLAMVIAEPDKKNELVGILESTPFHPSYLRLCQEMCRKIELSNPTWGAGFQSSADWASAYFVCAWMSRNGTAGTKREFDAGIATRWTAGGGDSAVRFRNATESLNAWSEAMRRCTFECIDLYDFLDKVKDRPKHGVYIDPPFPHTGDSYKHNCGDNEKSQEEWHTKLRDRLKRFDQCRIVCRFYDTPLIRGLYPESEWEWMCHVGRKQTNEAAPEVLIVRN